MMFRRAQRGINQFRKRVKRAKQLDAPSQHVKRDRRDEDRAERDFLNIRIHYIADHCQPTLDHLHKQQAKKCAEDAPVSAKEADSAHHDTGNDEQLPSLSGLRLGDGELGHDENSCHCRKDSGNDEAREFDKPRIDAGDARHFSIAASGVDARPNVVKRITTSPSVIVIMKTQKAHEMPSGSASPNRSSAGERCSLRGTP